MATILCIEDEADLREDIAGELEDEGYDVLQAGDGNEGLKLILQHKPDLVLCDISMPDKDGYQLLKEIREKYTIFADMPFIFVSALSEKDDVIAGLKLGADNYITKPIDLDLLTVKVWASLRQIERIRENHPKASHDAWLVEA
ncbi:MAG: response regulator transcription factor [Methyloligellaceae bacterium]